MQQFIPFEDEWDALEQLDPSRLVPYQVGLPCRRVASAQRTTPVSAVTSGGLAVFAPIPGAVPAGSSGA